MASITGKIVPHFNINQEWIHTLFIPGRWLSRLIRELADTTAGMYATAAERHQIIRQEIGRSLRSRGSCESSPIYSSCCDYCGGVIVSAEIRILRISISM